jgi:hypothetical protein
VTGFGFAGWKTAVAGFNSIEIAEEPPEKQEDYKKNMP